MDRYWLLTWTTYGTWLPGDDRGFVSNVLDGEGPEVKHNLPGTKPDAKQRGLLLSATANRKGPAVFLALGQAEVVLEQLSETAQYRGWDLLAVAIMGNHIHVIVGVPGDPDPATLIGIFKSYVSRLLNKHFCRPVSGTWWTESGSRRKLPDEAAVLAAIAYVGRQNFPLLIWRKGERGAKGP